MEVEVLMTIIMLPTWNVDGLTFNTSDGDVEWIVHNDEGWDNPPELRDSLTPRVVGHGSYESDSYLGPKLIVLDGLLRGSSRTAVERALRQLALVGGGLVSTPLVVAGYDLELTCNVKRAARPSTRRVSTTDVLWQLSLLAPDPRKYSTAYQVLTTGIATDAPGGVLWNGPAGSTGTPWNGPAGVTGVVWQSGSGTTGTVTLTNQGTASASIQFVITDTVESVVTPSIVDTSTGRTITYGGTITAGTSLAIDTGAGSVLLDGANRGPLLTRDEWFSIPPLSSIQVLFSSPSPAPNAQLLARWRDAYL